MESDFAPVLPLLIMRSSRLAHINNESNMISPQGEMSILTLHLSDPKDVWRLQFETTRRLTMPKWLSFFFIGLDYQLEHHLFPRIPHQRLPKVAEITRRWSKENGVPYHEISYVDGLIDARRFMAKSWRLEPEDIVTIRAERDDNLEAAAA